ncbi:MAG: hypothetical protein ACYTGE_11270 [Planctomycetota bacterium]
MATKRTTLAGMLADHDIRQSDVGSVGIGTQVDLHSQVATLARLDPQNPALPQLRHALEHNPQAVPGMLGQVEATQPEWKKWLPLLLTLAGLLGVWWYWESRKKRRRRNVRVDDETFDELELDIED